MQYWDSKGRLHDTEATNKVNFFQNLANQAQAGLDNLDSWINNTNPNSEAYRQKADVLASLITLPIGGGVSTWGTKAIANGLKPYVGRKIAQATTEGLTGGTAAGLVAGALDSGLKNENPLTGALKGGVVGGLSGLAGGYGLSKIGQQFAKKGVAKSTQQANQYFNDYIDGLTNKTKPMAEYRGLKQGINKGTMQDLLDQIGWHGSPYDFDKFDNKFIGSGEGAQVHGLGHYIALDKDVADNNYRKRLSDDISNRRYLYKGKEVEDEDFERDLSSIYEFPDGLQDILDRYEYTKGLNNQEISKYNKYLTKYQEALKSEPNSSFEKMIKSYQEDIDALNKKNDLLDKKINLYKNIDIKDIDKRVDAGTLYKTSIPDDDVFLREDLPISQQPQKVQDALKNILSEENVDNIANNLEILQNKIKKERRTNGETEYLNSLIKEWESLNNKYGVLFNLEPNNLISNGKTLYSNLVDYAGNPQKASQLLNDHGIKGISYNGGIDGEARVIFNPDDIKILEKNGVPVEQLPYQLNDKGINVKELPEYIEKEVIKPAKQGYWQGIGKNNYPELVEYFNQGHNLDEALNEYVGKRIPVEGTNYTPEQIEKNYNKFINNGFKWIEPIQEQKIIQKVSNPDYVPLFNGTEDQAYKILEDYDNITSTDKIGHGYNGYSMSNNAVDAYNKGSKPISKWTKNNLLDSIYNVAERYDIPIDKEKLSKMTTQDLKNMYLKKDGYHHTSKFYNDTDFYKVNLNKMLEDIL